VSTTAFTFSASCNGVAHPGAIGCFVPFTSTPFGAPSTTSGVLYGARQLQMGFRLEF